MKINHMRITQIIYAELSIGKGVSTITYVWKRLKGRQRSEKGFVGGKDKGQLRGTPLDDVGLGGGTKQKESILCDWLEGAHLAFCVCLCVHVPNSLQHYEL